MVPSLVERSLLQPSMGNTVHLFAALPTHCYPTSTTLARLSSLLGTCIPTPLALTSTAFGCLSILSWLFAQAPQCIKNYRLKTAAGLSILFLGEWLLGDLSNLSGALLTNQATWQVVVAVYYCLVDIVLVFQWVWYEKLAHGRQLKIVQGSDQSRWGGADGTTTADCDSTEPVVTAATVQRQSSESGPRYSDEFRPTVDTTRDRPADRRRHTSGTRPNAGRLLEESSGAGVAIASPQIILLISMLVCLARASPLHKTSVAEAQEPNVLDYLGTGLSWASTLLYLGSRVPQIVKNIRRRSTAGLSPLLFAAAFSGNFFYSASMIANPCAWASYPAFGAHGWVRQEPSDQVGWIKNALPFFLGAAGVLMMDATVGLQFWVYGEDAKSRREMLVVEGTGVKRWREVKGWMRGWKPTAAWNSQSREASITGHRDAGENQTLLSRSPRRLSRHGYGTGSCGPSG